MTTETTFEIVPKHQDDPDGVYVVLINRKYFNRNKTGQAFCYIYLNKNIKIRKIRYSNRYNNYYIDLEYKTADGFYKTCKYVEGYNKQNWTAFNLGTKFNQKDIDLLNITIFKDFVNIFKIKDAETVSFDLDNLTKLEQNIYIKRLFNHINNNNNKYSKFVPNIADSITNAINSDYDLLQEKKINDANEKYKKQFTI
jgi:hypothetical protein